MRLPLIALFSVALSQMAFAEALAGIDVTENASPTYDSLLGLQAHLPADVDGGILSRITAVEQTQNLVQGGGDAATMPRNGQYDMYGEIRQFRSEANNYGANLISPSFLSAITKYEKYDIPKLESYQVLKDLIEEGTGQRPK